MNDLLTLGDAHATVDHLDPSRVARAVQILTDIAEHTTYDDPCTFINLPLDTTILARVEDAVRSLDTSALKHVILIGIGGSSLGMRALLPTVPASGVRLHVIETVSGYEARALTNLIDQNITSTDEVAVIIASKSGNTTETVVNAGLCIDGLEKKLGLVASRIAVVTDEGSMLATFAEEHRYKVVEMPKSIGGRYSVFSPVGLLPFGLMRGALSSVLSGARDARTTFLAQGAQSIAARYGAMLAAYVEAGYRTHNMFVFDPALEDLGKWWRQLVGESLGKNTRRTGEPAHTSILPTVSVGSGDLHSVGQLYLSGAPGIATTFLSVGQPEVIVPAQGIAATLVPGTGTVSYEKILSAILEGTMQAYQGKGLPYLSIRLRDLSPEALGAFMQTNMIAVAIAGELLNVNAFDQPNVEDYKRITRELLRG